MQQQEEFYRSAISPTDCVGNAWSMVQQNYWLLFGMTAVAWLIMFAVGIILCLPVLNVIGQQIVAGPLLCGLYYAYLKQIRGEPVEFGMLFWGFSNRFLPAMVVSLIYSIPLILIQIIQVAGDVTRIVIQASQGRNSGAPAAALGVAAIVLIAVFAAFFVLVIFNIILFFVFPLIVENEGMGPIQAIGLSARAAWGNLGGLIVFGMLYFLLTLLGVVMLCVGIFFVAPILYASVAFAYRQVFPDITRDPKTFTPPPPNSYGANYGFGQQS